MHDLDTYLQTLATVNRHGFGFLLAYGLTWVLASLVWRAKGERAGAYAAVFQGMVALPLAFGLTALTARGSRPTGATMDLLSTYLATSQLMMLPLVIALVVSRRYTMAAAALAATTAVHFLPYAWLYKTQVYVVMGMVLAIGVAMMVRLEERRGASSGGQICMTTGVVLLVGAAVTWFLP